MSNSLIIICFLITGITILLLRLVYVQKELNLVTLRYSEIKKSNKEEKLHNLPDNQLLETNMQQGQLIKLLVSYIKNKPVLLLFDKPLGIPKVKRSFEIKRNGIGSCRVKSTKEGGKRITRTGMLALENPEDHSYLMIEDIEKASKLTNIVSFGEAVLNRRLYEVIDTSE